MTRRSDSQRLPAERRCAPACGTGTSTPRRRTNSAHVSPPRARSARAGTTVLGPSVRGAGLGQPHPRDDEGNAVVEFLGVALLLLVPVVYLVLVLAQLQASAFAVDGAAREAARAVAAAPDEATGATRAVAATALAFADQGLDAEAAAEALTVACTPGCNAPGAEVTVTVLTDVPLPLVPTWLGDRIPLTVPVSATATTALDPFAARR